MPEASRTAAKAATGPSATGSRELHVLWITGGLSCNGDSVSNTAATQLSIEEVVLGAIPGLPKVHRHHAVPADEVGTRSWRRFAGGTRRA